MGRGGLSSESWWTVVFAWQGEEETLAKGTWKKKVGLGRNPNSEGKRRSKYEKEKGRHQCQIPQSRKTRVERHLWTLAAQKSQVT